MDKDCTKCEKRFRSQTISDDTIRKDIDRMFFHWRKIDDGDIIIEYLYYRQKLNDKNVAESP